MTDIYVSIDIETTGPAPGLYSMISLGAAAFTKHGEELGTWSQNLAELNSIWPAAFDFAFVNWYCHRFTGGNPLGYACVDIRSLAQGLTFSRGYYDLRENQIKAMRGEVDREGLTEHVAVDDAIEQGRLLVALLRRTKGGVPKEMSGG